jgi:hypothetical protein
MSAVLSFENQLFISYSHIDNGHVPEVSKGWIDLLHERLNWRLPQLLGAPVKIWRDRKLAGNDVFNETIVIELSKTAILVSVISPRYLQSSACRQELEDFFRFASQNGGLRIGDKHRVFKVVKTQIPREDHLPALREMLGYEFYAVDQASGRFREYDHEIGPRGERDRRFWDKLEDLAQDICFLLQRMVNEQSPQSAEPTSLGATIYLAETSFDLSEERDKVKRELQQYGHVVLPDKALPLKAPLLQDAVRDYLKRCSLSVHFIGENYGIIPEMEAERSIVCLQQELAVERGDDEHFSRLIWMPVGLQPKDERQRKFVLDLQTNFTSSNGSELLQVKLEDLKTIIQSKLFHKPKFAPVMTDEASAVRIYLICDQQDLDAVEPMRNYLLEQGYEAILPLSEGSEAEVFKDHKENILLCDAVLIFQGRASEGWLRMKLRELLKLPGYGRAVPLLGKAVYIGGSESSSKERFKTLQALVIKNYEEFNPASLEPFLTRISQAKEG